MIILAVKNKYFFQKLIFYGKKYFWWYQLFFQDEEFKKENQALKSSLPFAIIGGTLTVEVPPSNMSSIELGSTCRTVVKGPFCWSRGLGFESSWARGFFFVFSFPMFLHKFGESRSTYGANE